MGTAAISIVAVALTLALAVAGARGETQTRDALLGLSTATSEKVIVTENIWTNLTHAACDSGASAYVYMQALQRSALLVVRGFGFSIPPNATINGIRVTWTVRITDPTPSTNRTHPHEVALVGAASAGVVPPTPRWNTPVEDNAVQGWTSSWGAAAYPLPGGDTMWGGGAPAAGAGVSSPLFGVAMSANNLNIAELDIQVACVSVEVNFTADGASSTGPTAAATTGATTGAFTTATATTGATTAFASSTSSASATAPATATTAATATTTTGTGGPPPQTSTLGASDDTATVSESTAGISSWLIVGPALGFLACIVCMAWTFSRYMGWRRQRAVDFMNGVGLPRATSRGLSDDSESDPGAELDGSSDAGQLKMGECVWLDDVAIGHEIGSGNFGSVYLGTWHKGTNVACKTLTGADVDDDAMEEARKLSHLNHPNIVRFFGLYRDTRNEVFIVMEYLKKGALDAFLKTSTGQSLSNQERLRVCTEIATGMHYLSRKKIVHGDLSARNILVSHLDDAISAKISDFGLSLLCDRGPGDKGAVETEQYCRVPTNTKHKFPVRHSAPEVIASGRYSSQSDVWSFGVVVWEIYSDGGKPFEGVRNADIQQLVSHAGGRLERPPACPEPVYALMQECWHKTRALRPSFSDVRDELTRCTASSGCVEDAIYNTIDFVKDAQSGGDADSEIVYETL